ncbi:MAG TPA: GYD domain-containing protein [Xanthobacteraceae bacterium]|nr:GYD domain-containing protein [Xanthobacteraceae bacterium]
MATYVMFGTYSPEAIKGISAKRSDEAKALIKKEGGELKAAYALLGDIDLLLIVDLPDPAHVMRAAAALNRLTGIAFASAPALPIEEFDKAMA